MIDPFVEVKPLPSKELQGASLHVLTSKPLDLSVHKREPAACFVLGGGGGGGPCEV